MDSGKPICPRTKQHYLKACKQFASWMVKDGRAGTNPFQHLTIGIKVESQNPRRALGQNEILTLLSYTENSKPIGEMSGLERALVYRLAMETGLCANELRSLKRNSFDFEKFTVTVRGKYTKNRNEAVQPVKPATIKAIQEHLKLKTPTAAAFNLPNNNLAKFFKKDIEDARLGWIEAAQSDPQEYLRPIEREFLKLKTKGGQTGFPLFAAHFWQPAGLKWRPSKDSPKANAA